MGSPRTASPTVYIQEELSDARLRCDELKHYLVRALDLINSSPQKDHFYAISGDIIFAAPETLLKLERALGAVSMAVNKVDFEEQRQLLRPEKVDELERVLEDVRVNIPRRLGNQSLCPIENQGAVTIGRVKSPTHIKVDITKNAGMAQAIENSALGRPELYDCESVK